MAFFVSEIISNMFKALTHRSLARLVLVWFALFIGVAIASPILNPTETQMVCSSAGGMKMVAFGRKTSEFYWPNVEKLGCDDCIKPLFL